MKGFIIYQTYRIFDKKAYIALFGRLENGESFLTLTELKPYFYIKTSDLEKAKELADFDYEETDFTNFNREKVTKITLTIPKEVPELRDELKEIGIKTYEADVRFAIRYLIDNQIHNSIEIEGEFEINEKIDRVYKEPEIKPAEYFPTNIKVLSLDVESSSDGKELYCISFYSKDYKKSFLVGKADHPDTISCKSEEELLEKFQEELIDFDPDIITGWNVIDFDLVYLKEKFKKYEIPFILGRDNSVCRISLETNFFRTSKASIYGRLVLDGLDLIKSSFIKLENYKLNTAAKKLLGKSKLIESTGPEKYKEIDNLYKTDIKKLLEYNLLDSELAYRILTEAELLNLAIRRSLITGMQLDKVNASIASFDFLYLEELKKKKLVAPTGSFKEKLAPIKGGFVKESSPGIYDNIVVLDFKSLYPSIIRTFNLDPASYLEKPEKDSIKSPNGAYFRAEDGILPIIIQKLWYHREKARKTNDELGRYAIKILMNSFFGIMANPSCRFFNTKIANAITSFGQEIIKQTGERINQKGYEVIYQDTDSNFVNTKTESYDEAVAIGKKLQDEINSFYENLIKVKYKRKSYLEMEYEKCYKRFLMPKVRSGEAGAKKRYAGLLLKDGKEKIEFVGLEVRRSDWTDAAKEFQEELLDRVFHKKEVTVFIKKYVEEINTGKRDKQLVYKKSIRKDLDQYTKTTPPHIKAARKLKKLESNIIEYYQTTEGPEPIQELKHNLDYQHYIDKQIKPIADSILELYGTTFEEVLEGAKQTTLFGFK
ncbi:MAG: DNA polymerase II [Candidatus Woesearchaeota archaeon]